MEAEILFPGVLDDVRGESDWVVIAECIICGAMGKRCPFEIGGIQWWDIKCECGSKDIQICIGRTDSWRRNASIGEADRSGMSGWGK